jgi:hypothetical protein
MLEREILEGHEVMQLVAGQELPPSDSAEDSTQQVFRPDAGRRVPKLSDSATA